MESSMYNNLARTDIPHNLSLGYILLSDAQYPDRPRRLEHDEVHKDIWAL